MFKWGGGGFFYKKAQKTLFLHPYSVGHYNVSRAHKHTHTYAVFVTSLPLEYIYCILYNNIHMCICFVARYDKCGGGGGRGVRGGSFSACTLELSDISHTSDKESN